MTFRTHHLCQSVTGPLMNYTKRDWAKMAKYTTMRDGTRPTPEALKMHFLAELAKGHEVIPLTHDPCEGFDWKHGCPGHPAPEQGA